jgi:tetratricopeptide (TPR) repeat protein
MKAVLALVLAVTAVSATAFADKADELFKQGKKLMAEKKFAEACPKLEASFQADATIGTELNIGRCYEEWGKLGKAYRAYSDAQKRADDAKDNRAPKIKELIAKLEPSVPRLVIHIPDGAETAGLQVAVDGVAVADLTAPQLVDPGPKSVEYALGSGTRKSKLVPMERGATSEITLDLPKAKTTEKVSDKIAVTTKPAPVTEPAAPNVGHGQRVAGVVIAGAGVVTVGISTYLALAARSKYNDALAANCMGMTNACNMQGLTDTHDARSAANTATIIGGVGLAAIAAGVIVYVIAPHSSAATEHALYVAPSTGGTGLAFGGRF